MGKRGPKPKYHNGEYSSPEYRIWASMKNRCLDSKNWAWSLYGQKGISVCDEWLVFENFYRDMGNRPGPNYELDRINNDEGYNPTNCQWIPKHLNLRKRKCVIKTIINGEELTLKEISEKYNLSFQSVYIRYTDLLDLKVIEEDHEIRGELCLGD